MPKRQNPIEKTSKRLDKLQQKYPAVAFVYAIIKKYGDDQAGYLAALLAYYAFVSLMPLLIVATSVLQIFARNDEHIREIFLRNAASYFPVLGDNLVNSLETPSKSGLALVIGLLITLYGARGVAIVIQHTQNHLWCVPRWRRTNFPQSIVKGFGLIFIGGLGFVIAASLTSYAGGASHVWPLRLLVGTAGFMVLFAVFLAIFAYGPSKRQGHRVHVPGALFAAFGLLILQAFGGYIIAHQLRVQTGLTAQFATVLVLLFWLYLQAQVFIYAIEINSVLGYKLWPRSVDVNSPLRADTTAYDLYASREVFLAPPTK